MTAAGLLDRLQRGAGHVDRLSDMRTGVLIVALGLALAIPGLITASSPNSDGLFYEVQAKELEGETHAEAMEQVFSSEEARETAAIEDRPSGAYRVLNPAWQEFSAQFYERRWLVPGLAIGVSAATGEGIATAIKTVSMLGYALIGLVLFLLLRRRFSLSASAAAAIACMLLPPMYRWSFGQFVDSWGVLLESLGLLALVLISDRGLRWLPLWIGAMLALSITRDATMILGLAAFWVAVSQLRAGELRRRSAWILASGAAAALPALLLGGAPVNANLAYIYGGYNVPIDTGWGHVIVGYPAQLLFTIQGNLEYPLEHGKLGLGLYLVLAVSIAAVALVSLRRPRGDAYWLMSHGAILGCTLLLLVANNPQGYRLELVFIPVIASGFAIALARIFTVRRA